MNQQLGDVVAHVETPPRLERRRLIGRSVQLREPDPARDAAALFEPTQGSTEKESVWVYMPYGPFADEDEMHTWLEERSRLDDPMSYVVARVDDDQAVGVAAMMNADLSMRRLELGHIWYTQATHRTGINTEAAFLMLSEAFEHYRCRRVEWKCDSLNEPSRHAAIRLGFVFEGIFHKHLIVKGRNRDTAWYAMTDDQWPRVREVLDEWLEAPDPKPSLSAAMTRAQV